MIKPAIDANNKLDILAQKVIENLRQTIGFIYTTVGEY